MLGVFAEFETNLRRERQAEGITAAKHRGVYRGRPPKIDMGGIRALLFQGTIAHTDRPGAGDFPRHRLQGKGIDVKAGKNKALAPAKAKPPRNLTPALCERLRRDLLAACRQVAETHGLAVEGGDLSDIDLRHGFDIGFRVGIPTTDGTLFSHEKALFDALAGSFGLEPSDYARTFRTGGETFASPQSTPTARNTRSAPNASPMAVDTSSPPKTSCCTSASQKIEPFF